MPIKAKLTSNAVVPNQANVMVGTVKNPLTATGTNQATAFQLSLDDNHVFTTVAAGTGAVLQAAYAPGDTIRVANHGANNLLLYPASGGSIANAAASAPLTIIPTGQAILTSIDGPSKNWAATVSQAPSTGTVSSISVVTANGISGTVSNPTTTPAITLAVDSASYHPGFVSGRLYPWPGAQAGSSFNTAANIIYASPFYVPFATTFVKQTIYANSTGHAHLGIYNNSSGAPSTLFVDNGAMNIAGTGEQSLTVSNALSAGWYWVAALFDGVITMQFSTTTIGIGNWLSGMTSGSLGSGLSDHQTVQASQSYGALPGTFPALTYNNAATPLIWLGT